MTAIVMRIAAIGLIVLNGIVIAIAALQQTARSSFDDWLILVSPFLFLLVCLAISLSTFWINRLGNQWIRGLLWGAFAGGFLFLVIQGVLITPRHTLIANDGVAYWALVFMPTVLLGAPLLVLGCLVGLSWVRFSRRSQ